MISKYEQRKRFLEQRKNIENDIKKQKDIKILQNLMNNETYINTDKILIYVSTDFEVDTINIINHSLTHDKKVYIPYVTNKKRIMAFYEINNVNNLVKNKFGILEPIPLEQNKFDNSNSLCIVPAIIYDKLGYRIGYGGGYYDKL